MTSQMDTYCYKWTQLSKIKIVSKNGESKNYSS